MKGTLLQRRTKTLSAELSFPDSPVVDLLLVVYP